MMHVHCCHEGNEETLLPICSLHTNVVALLLNKTPCFNAGL